MYHDSSFVFAHVATTTIYHTYTISNSAMCLINEGVTNVARSDALARHRRILKSSEPDRIHLLSADHFTENTLFNTQTY
jgi:hypothetical protein